MGTQNSIDIKQTISYALISDEARQLSVKLQNKIYVIYRDNGLFNTLVQENGEVLSVWYLGKQIEIVK